MTNITKFLMTCLISSMALLSTANSVYAQEASMSEAIYANGGIGQEETDEMRAKAGDYNLRLYMSEGKNGHAITGVQVSITDKKGKSVLDMPSSGPMLFAHVENGSYRINAIYNGTTISRKVVISNHRGVNVYLTWRAADVNVDYDMEDSASE